MTIKEALEIFRKEDDTIKTLVDPETGDIYIVKPTGFGTLLDPETGDIYLVKPTEFGMTPPTALAWVCGKEADRFICYEGLDKSESYGALCDLAETLPKEREDK